MKRPSSAVRGVFVATVLAGASRARLFNGQLRANWNCRAVDCARSRLPRGSVPRMVAARHSVGHARAANGWGGVGRCT